MKTQLKLIFFLLGVISFISTQCKAQPATSSRASKLIDSLHITNSDEIKICNLYDEVITDYANAMKQWSTGNQKANAAQANELQKKYQQQMKDIQPQVDSFKKTVQGNYQEAMKFAQFCALEGQRIYGAMAQYQQGMYKAHGTSQPTTH